MGRRLVLLPLLLAAGVAVASGAGAQRAAPAQQVPPSGTYTGTFTSGKGVSYAITCTASTCTIPLDAGLQGPATLNQVGPGHYQLDRPLTKQLVGLHRFVCPIPASAQMHIDLAFGTSDAVLNVTVDSFETRCGITTEKLEGFTFGATLQAPRQATTSTAAPTTTTVASATTVTPTTLPAVTTTAPSTLSSRQRASLRAVRRHTRTPMTAALSSPSEALGGDDVVTNGLLAGALVLLLVFPAELFNATYEKHHLRVERAVAALPWWPRRRGRAPGRTGRAMAGTQTGATVAVTQTADERSGIRVAQVGLYLAVLAAGSVIAGFLDPDFGLDRASVMFVVGMVLSSLVGTVVGWLGGGTFRRARRLSTASAVDAVPSGLIVAAIGVVISRLVHFEPGYLYGLVGGLAFVVALEGEDEGRSQFVTFLTRLVVAVVAWLVFVPVSRSANALHPSAMVQLLDAVLATAFIGGVEATLFGLVPLRSLPGHDLSRWSWPAWIATAAVASFLFVDVLLRPASGYLGRSSTASAVVIYGLFGLFGLASVLFWGWFRLHPDDPTADPPPAGPDAAPASAAPPGPDPAAAPASGSAVSDAVPASGPSTESVGEAVGGSVEATEPE